MARFSLFVMINPATSDESAANKGVAMENGACVPNVNSYASMEEKETAAPR